MDQVFFFRIYSPSLKRAENETINVIQQSFYFTVPYKALNLL